MSASPLESSAESLHPEYDDWYDGFEGYDDTCDYCGGDGGDPWNDGITECPKCDGEGYKWWR